MAHMSPIVGPHITLNPKPPQRSLDYIAHIHTVYVRHTESMHAWAHAGMDV